MKDTLTQDFIYNKTAHLSEDTAFQSLLLWDEGCCFVRFDKDKKLIAAHVRHFKSYDLLKLENNLLEFELTKIPITLLVSSQRHTLIPTDFFDENSAPSWLKKLHFIEANELIKQDGLPQFKAHIAYPISVDVIALLEQYCAEVKVQSLASVITTQDTEMNMAESQANLYLIKDSFLMFLTHQNQLQLLLSEKYQTTSDLLYYIGSSIQQFNIKQHELKIRLNGIEVDLENTSREIQEFFPSINLIENNNLAYLDFFSKLNTCV